MNHSGESEILIPINVSLHMDRNVSTSNSDLFEDSDTIFDNQYVRLSLIFLYSLVFCFCFFGNLAVVLVVTLHWKMRSIPKFCLGNLAFANLCVSIFCIYQNLSTFLIDRWLFGPFMCKMYHFINSLSHTASILILVVICVERYLAILHPFKSRRWITKTRLRVAIVTVWIVSAVVCSPRLYYINTINFPVTGFPGGVICAPKHSHYNAPLVDMIYFIVLFLLPLLAITILYTRIGIYVWRGSGVSRSQMHNPSQRRSNFAREDYASETCSSGSDFDSLPNNTTNGESFKMGKVPREFPFRAGHSTKYSSSSEDAQSSGTKDPSEVITHIADTIPESNSPDNIFSSDMSKNKRKKLSFTIFGRKKSKKKISRVKSRSKAKLRSQSSVCFNEEEISTSQNAKTPETFEIETQILASEASAVNYSEGNMNNSCGVESLSLKSSKLLRKKMLRRRKSSSRNNTSICRNGSRREKCARPRLAVLRLLIVIVASFAICNLPFHIRKICISYLPNYEMDSTFSNVLAPLTFLLMYTNCAINPIIYAFMSKGFRSSLVDLVKCRFRRSFLKNRRARPSA